MLKAVVFDMDDTLLSINLSAFLAVYVRDEARLLGDIGRKNPFSALAALGGSLYDLNANVRDEDDDRTNYAFFVDTLRKRCGVPIDDPVIADAFECYEREVLPKRNDAIIAARPREGAARLSRRSRAEGSAWRSSPTRASATPASNAAWAGETCSTCRSSSSRPWKTARA